MSFIAAARRFASLQKISLKQLKCEKYVTKLTASRAYATHIITPESSSIKCYTNNNVSYATTSTDFHLIPDTVGDRIRVMSQLYPGHKVFSFPHNRGLSFSFAELKQRCDVISQNLLELGFKKGDRLALILPNTAETVLLFLAAAQIGLITVIMSPAYQLVEVEYMLKKTGAKGVVFYDSFKVLQHLEIINKICPELSTSEPGKLDSERLPDLKHVFVLNSPLMPEKKTYKGTWSFEHLAAKKSHSNPIEFPQVEMDDSCLILFTSGTTGKPKGATLSHFGLINSGLMSSFMCGKDPGNKNICSPIPLFHIFGFVSGLIVPMLIEDSRAVFPFFFPDTLATMKTINDYKCISIRGPPITYIDILNHPDRSKFDLSSLEHLVFGGSTVPPDLLIRLKKELNIKSIIVGYGMTETTMCQATTCISDVDKSFRHAFESVGRPVPFTEAKIVDPVTGKIQPLNTDGELLIRGFNIMKGYWDEPELTTKVIDKNGWLRTGDILSMDSEGYLYFKSRSKDVIIRGGANIYPAEVESYLRTNPKISQVYVFGVPDKRLTEEVAAWIKLKPNESMTEEELKAFCIGNISQFKIPRYIKFVESFPMNVNGKVQLNVMEEISKQEFNL